MKSIHKKIIWSLTFIVLCFTGLHQTLEEPSADNSKSYLVLVQEKDGTWTQYSNLVEVSDDGNIMIRAKLLSKALGLTYKRKQNGAFDIKRNVKRYNSYSRYESRVVYVNGAVISKITVPYRTYTSSTSKYNLCHISSVSTLVNYKVFDPNNESNYDSYDKIICYSKYNEIPDTIPLSTAKKSPKTMVSLQEEPSAFTIEGIEYPVRDKFLTVKNALSDWGGTGMLWSKLESQVDQKILSSTDLIIGTDSIEFTHLTSGSNGITLKQVGKGYELAISVRLTGSVISDQNAMIVKAMIATISSQPSIVYQAIIESFITDNAHGINEDKFVVIGDCKIMIELKDDIVIYHIKEA